MIMCTLVGSYPLLDILACLGFHHSHFLVASDNLCPVGGSQYLPKKYQQTFNTNSVQITGRAMSGTSSARLPDNRIGYPN